MAVSSTFWCNNCNVPLIKSDCEICESEGVELTKTGVKPVFPEEKKNYDDLVSRHLNRDTDAPTPLYRSRNRLYHQGKIFSALQTGESGLEINGSKSLIRKRVENAEYERSIEESLDLAVKANKEKLLQMEEEALEFIKKTSEENSEREKYVSFSGGKDSAIVAYLAKKSLGDIPLLFSNTTIELPETLEYVESFSEELGLELKKLNPPRPFFEMVDEFGPPSRMMRWCCFTQKSAPINNFYKDLDNEVLSYDGMRKVESQARSKYARERDNTKIIRQRSAYPIFEWSDLAVWLYIHFRSIPINSLYRSGRTRVGCWACPNNGKLSNYYIKKLHPDLVKKWEEKLLEYAKENGKDEEWVKNGNWRSRKTKYNDKKSIEKNSPCGKGKEFVYEFENKEVTEDFLEYLKIFGEFEINDFNGSKIARINSEDVKIFAIIGKKEIKIKFENAGRLTKLRVEKQIEKALNCTQCGACIGACPQGAISVNPKFQIDDEKCTKCRECATSEHLKQACAALHYKSERKKIDS